MPSTFSSSVVPFSSCPQSFPASGSFQMCRLFTSGVQSIRAPASILPMNIQNWFPLGWTSWISLQSKGLSRIFSNTTAQKHQFSLSLIAVAFNSIPSLMTILLCQKTTKTDGKVIPFLDWWYPSLKMKKPIWSFWHLLQRNCYFYLLRNNSSFRKNTCKTFQNEVVGTKKKNVATGSLR